jgi:hypothetical protein
MSDIPEAVREAYWKDLIHLCELGLVELTLDGKGVEITPKGRAYWLQSRKLNNGEP